MWKATKKSNGTIDPRLLTTKQKETWENHPIIKGKYRYDEVADPKKPNVQEPFEAKVFKQKEHKQND